MSGEQGKLVDFVVERGAIQIFAAAAQSEHPEHTGDDAVSPATFLMSVAHWMPADAKVSTGFERARLLHGSQEFEFMGVPPRAGARLTAREQIVDRYEKEGRKGGLMRFAVVETEFRAADTNEVVARMRATLIEREARGEQ
ncbi:MAG: MaoC family dehydratase N-terminal domain-containing protein [Rhodoglobus sp.]|nr:MaoC family dehydratase N-terminal domain-containing protein [Rhodoglobus sp.]